MMAELSTKCAAVSDASGASVRRAGARLAAALGGFGVDVIGYRNRTGRATSA